MLIPGFSSLQEAVTHCSVLIVCSCVPVLWTDWIAEAFMEPSKHPQCGSRGAAACPSCLCSGGGGQSPARCSNTPEVSLESPASLFPKCMSAGRWRMLEYLRGPQRHRESTTQKGPRNLLPGPQEPSSGNSPNHYCATLFINFVKTIYMEKLDFFFSFWLSQDDTGPLQSLLRFLPQRDQLLLRFSKSSKLVSPIYHQQHPLTCTSSRFFTWHFSRLICVFSNILKLERRHIPVRRRHCCGIVCSSSMKGAFSTGDCKREDVLPVIPSAIVCAQLISKVVFFSVKVNIPLKSRCWFLIDIKGFKRNKRAKILHATLFL